MLVQTTGFALGGNTGPLLFAMLIRDLPQRIKSKHRLVRVLMFAHDLCLFSVPSADNPQYLLAHKGNWSRDEQTENGGNDHLLCEGLHSSARNRLV